MGIGKRGMRSIVVVSLYCCKASEALGLPLCIIFVIFSHLDFQRSDGSFPKSISLAQRAILKEVVVLCCVRSALSLSKELEQHNDLLQCGALQVKSIRGSSHLNTKNQDDRRYYRCTDDAQR